MKDEVNPYMPSAAALKALERFSTNNGLSNKQPSKPELLPLPNTDWVLWAQMPKATLMEVVAVSLNLDPRAIKPPTKFAALTETIYAAPGIEFDRRLTIACAHLGKTGPIKTLDFLPPEHLFHGPATATVSLQQFAQWALGMGWELPEKFPRFKAAPPAPETPAPAPRTSQSDAVQRMVKNAPQNLSAASVPTLVPPASPVVAESAPGCGEPDQAEPLPLTTGDIAFCFAGLRWDEQQWKKPLGDKPKWLQFCIAIPGARGVSETRWNPVLIGAALIRGGHAKSNSVRAKFQTVHLLQPWLETWKTYEADNI